MTKETLTIDLNNQDFKAKLVAIGFKEGNSHILYIPSLKLSSYGDTIKEAHQMMKISLDAFAKDLFSLPVNKIHNFLAELGWEKHKYFRKRLQNLSQTTFEDIRKEFNLPEDIEVESYPIAV